MINPVFLIAIPLLVAFISVFIKKASRILLSIAADINITLSIALLLTYSGQKIYEIGGFKPPFGISLVLDNYSIIGIVILNILFGLSLILSWSEIKKIAPVLTVALAALNGMLLTGDMFNLFVFFEIGAIAAYLLTSMNKGYKESFNYLIMGSIGSGMFLLGTIIFYNIFGTLNIFDLEFQMDFVARSDYKIIALPIALIFAGLAVEAKLIPFAGWVRGVLKDAKTITGTMLLSVYSFVVVMVFGRIAENIFLISDEMLMAFSIIATLTLILGEFSAFSKKNLKEIILFSSIAQSGLAVLMFLYNLEVAAIMILIGNVVSKLVLFAVADKLKNTYDTDDIYELKGVFVKYPVLGFAFSVSALSVSGLPLFYGFIAKLKSLTSLIEIDNFWLPAIMLMVAVVEGAYFIRILVNLWNASSEGNVSRNEDAPEKKIEGVWTLALISGIIAILLIAGGIIPLANLNEYMGTETPQFIISLLGGAL